MVFLTFSFFCRPKKDCVIKNTFGVKTLSLVLILKIVMAVESRQEE